MTRQLSPGRTLVETHATGECLRSPLAGRDRPTRDLIERADAVEDKLSLEERKEVEQDVKAAEAWVSGLEAIRKKLGVKVVYDLRVADAV